MKENKIMNEQGKNNLEAKGQDSLPIEIRDPEINVVEVMNKIRERIEEKKKAGIYKDEPLFTQPIDILSVDILKKGFKDRTEVLKILGTLNLEGDPITSHRPILGSIIKTFKKIFRYWTRKYTDSLFGKQCQFNNEVVNILEKITEEVEEIKKQLKESQKGSDK